MPRNDKAFVIIAGQPLEVTAARCQGCEYFACGVCGCPGEGCGGSMRFADIEQMLSDLCLAYEHCQYWKGYDPNGPMAIKACLDYNNTLTAVVAYVRGLEGAR